MTLEEILRQVQAGRLTVEEGLQHLKSFPYDDIGCAKVDTHRQLRRGFPEVIFGQGKTPEQVQAIAGAIDRSGQKAIVTRANPEQFAAVASVFPRAVFYGQARIIVTEPLQEPPGPPRVLVLSAGTADLPVAEEAAITLTALGTPVGRLYDVGVAGIHRLLDHRREFSQAQVLIVVAGMEGALASVVAGLVDRPIVAVPTSVGYGASFSGLAPLLAMLNSCSTGVAVMNIDNGFGAACYAAQILRCMEETETKA